MAKKSTRYRVCTTDSEHRHYFTAKESNPVHPSDAPFSWAFDPAKAVTLSRKAACEFADTCGEYLTGYSDAAAKCARSIRIVPANGGVDIAYRFRPASKTPVSSVEDQLLCNL